MTASRSFRNVIILDARKIVDPCEPAYGAKGDGTTDDTAALQACIDANPGCKIALRGRSYLCSSGGLTVTGSRTILDGEGANLTFDTSTNISCVKITSGLTAPAGQDEIQVCNLNINGTDLLGNSNIGLHIIGKANLTRTSNITIRGIGNPAGAATGGIGFKLEGGVTGAANNSPEKGYHSHIFISDCYDGFVLTSGADVNGLMTQHTFDGCYVATVGTNGYAYKLYSVAEFSFLGASGESGGASNYGIYIDDLAQGGGNVFSGGFIEGYNTNFFYQNPNPSNPNVVLMKGGRGPATNTTNLGSMPAIGGGTGPGVVQPFLAAPVIDWNTTGSIVVSSDWGGSIITVKSRNGVFGRVQLASSDGTSAGAFTHLLEQSTHLGTLFTTSSTGNIGTINLFPTSAGFIMQNMTSASHPTLTVQRLVEG